MRAYKADLQTPHSRFVKYQRKDIDFLTFFSQQHTTMRLYLHRTSLYFEGAYYTFTMAIL